ncbi:prolyl oligopeptidase family serine peptidase [Corallincola holothuriorum]|uniref:prolyl oligopeptidase family serine peptidase n=1 Tax=Corallincola holothuriorum TaxID=2282215 RepID=UPI001314B03A|nr:prolyl oligopeptidase family serine peptidase [Corallincola holothuriorum]
MNIKYLNVKSRAKIYLAAFFLLISQVSVQAQKLQLTAPQDIALPSAKQISSTRSYHGKQVIDEYAWLIDEDFPHIDDPDVLSYIDAENHYYEQVMGSYSALTETILQEANAKKVELVSAETPAVRIGKYWYRSSQLPNSRFKIWERSPEQLGKYEQILDESKLTAADAGLAIDRVTFSPDGRYVAWGANPDDPFKSTLQFFDLHEQVQLDVELATFLPLVVWGHDSRGVFYPFLPEGGLNQIKYHRLGEEQEQDTLLFQEKRSAFRNEIHASSSGEYAFLFRGENRSLQVLAFSTKVPSQKPLRITAIKHNVMNYIDHVNGHFYMRTNDLHRGYRIAVAEDTGNGPGEWKTLFEGSDEIQLTRMFPFNDFVAVQVNRQGQSEIVILRNNQKPQWVAFPDKAYTATLARRQDPNQNTVLINYFSLTTPASDVTFDAVSGKLSGFTNLSIDTSKYKTERIFATARDGVNVPVTLFYRKDLRRPGQPLHLTGFGAFGQTGEGWPRGFKFSKERFSLLDRGILYAMAHVRGGGELGPAWHRAGEGMQRKNTFNDFVDVAQYLVKQGYTTKGNISISGDSAGGTLMGAALNQAPDLWAAAVLNVPWVDPLSEMLDVDGPTVQWVWSMYGNPLQHEGVFDYVFSYNPYSQIAAHGYPPQLVTTRWTDTDVPYWHAARWTAKMRSKQTNNSLVLLRTHADGNHFGGQTPQQDLREQAEVLTFILVAHGLSQTAADTIIK